MKRVGVVAILAGALVSASGIYAAGLTIEALGNASGEDPIAECQTTPLVATPDEPQYDPALGQYVLDGITVAGIAPECMDVGYLMYATATSSGGAAVGDFYPQLVTSNPALQFAGGSQVDASQVESVSVAIMATLYVPQTIGNPAFDPIDGDEGGTVNFPDDQVTPCVVDEDSFTADVDLFNPDTETRNYNVSPSSLVPADEFDVFDFLVVDITRDPYAGESGLQVVAEDVPVDQLETVDLIGKGSAVTHYHFTFTYPCAASPRSDETVPELVNGSFELPYVGSYMNNVNTGTAGFGWANTAQSYVNVWNNSNGTGITTPAGSQFAMLNSPTPGLLYQDVDTSGLDGETLQWALKHRSDTARNADSIRVQIGDPDGALSNSGGIITDGPSWNTTSGTYTVPNGQDTTRFAIQTLDGPTGNYGNFLDDVYFTLNGRIPGSANVQLQVVPAPVPGVPYNLSVQAEPTVDSDASAALSWAAPNPGGSAITDYGIQYSTNGGVDWLDYADGVATATEETLTPLPADATYVFRVRAKNSSGWGQWSSSTGSTQLSTPGVSQSIIATVSSGSSVDLYWNAPTPVPGNPVTDYTIRQSSNGGASWTTIPEGTSAATYLEVTGLSADTTYIYEVTAINNSGSGTSSQSGQATTSVPNAPGQPSRSAYSATAVNLWWSPPTAVPGAAVTDYKVQYSSNGGSSWSTATSINSSSPSTLVSGLSPNTSYIFRVQATNVVGTGGWSDPSTSITTPSS